MQPSKQEPTLPLRLVEFLYLSLVVISFYLLVISRTGEAHTVWEVLHPAFLPTLFVATSLLFRILLTSEKVAHKLLFIIIHSVLVHSLFSIILPAGDLSGQQMTLGRTRLVFDNTVFHGLTTWPPEAVHTFVFNMFKGSNLQAALCTIFARMLSIDIFWVHLFLIPILWGVFVPIASFLVTKTVSGDEKVSLLSSLLISAFPYSIYFGAISVPNSLGFIFFYYSLYFMLKHLTSNDPKKLYWMVIFSFFSLLSHPLTGIMSLSLLLFAVVFKAYKSQKGSLSTTRTSLIASFFISASLLPLSFIYLRFFGTTTSVFTLTRLHELPVEEVVGLFLIGDLIYSFDLQTTLLVVTGPAVGLLWMIYLLHKSKRKSAAAESRAPSYFLFAAFLVMIVDYRVLKLFMEGLPVNAERLWVFRDFIAVPFVALAICALTSSLKRSLKGNSLQSTSLATLRNLVKGGILRNLSLLLSLNVLIPMFLGGWVTFSLSVAYPQVGPLQTTWFELDAVTHIKKNTTERYVVIGDIWTIFAGEMIVGINNPQAFYFGEYDPRGFTLFSKMLAEPSPEVMIEAMNQTDTDTTIAYFVITEPRVGSEEFSNVVSRILQDNQLPLFGVFGDGKLYVFSYRKR